MRRPKKPQKVNGQKMLSFNKPHAGRPAVGLVDTGVPGATGTGGNCGVGVGAGGNGG